MGRLQQGGRHCHGQPGPRPQVAQVERPRSGLEALRQALGLWEGSAGRACGGRRGAAAQAQGGVSGLLPGLQPVSPGGGRPCCAQFDAAACMQTKAFQVSDQSAQLVVTSAFASPWLVRRATAQRRCARADCSRPASVRPRRSVLSAHLNSIGRHCMFDCNSSIRSHVRSRGCKALPGGCAEDPSL